MDKHEDADAENERPKEPTQTQSEPQAQSQNNKTIGLLIGIILLLLAIIIGIGLFTLTKDDSNDSSAETSKSSQPDSNDPKTVTPANKAYRTGIMSEKGNFQVQIDKVKSSANSVRFNITTTCKGIVKENSLDCWVGDLWVTQSDLAKTYMIDDAAQQKYEVIRDENGDPIVTNVEPISDITIE